MKQLYIKVIFFSVLITALCTLSYGVRDFLTTNYNNIDFPLISIDYVENTGAAFSILQSHTNLLIVISAFVLLIFSGFIFANIKRLKYTELILYAFMIAGVFCNLFERIMDGYVTDYIRLNFVAFPIFNLSDMFINIGAFLIICNILFNNEHKKS